MVELDESYKRKSILDRILTIPPAVWIIGGVIILFLAYQVQIRHILTWNQASLYIGIVLFILVMMGLQKSKTTEGNELSPTQCFEILFAERGWVKKLQSLNALSPGDLKPTGVYNDDILDSNTLIYEFGFKIILKFGVEEEYSARIDPKTGFTKGIIERPEGFTGKNMIKYKTHPQWVYQFGFENKDKPKI